MSRYVAFSLPVALGRVAESSGKPVPIPSYLIAIASGNLVYKSFPQLPGKKWSAGVWTEVRPPHSFPFPHRIELSARNPHAKPEGIDDAYWEFSADIARYISVAEDLTTPYTWGVYDTLVLPPSFPYGGEFRRSDATAGGAGQTAG
jgi:leukotriene-A4 hydrolase